MIESMMTLSGFGVSRFTLHVPEGWTPVPREFSVHLQIFVDVLFEVVEYGTRSAGESSSAFGRCREVLVKHFHPFLEFRCVFDRWFRRLGQLVAREELAAHGAQSSAVAGTHIRRQCLFGVVQNPPPFASLARRPPQLGRSLPPPHGTTAEPFAGVAWCSAASLSPASTSSRSTSCRFRFMASTAFSSPCFRSMTDAQARDFTLAVSCMSDSAAVGRISAGVARPAVFREVLVKYLLPLLDL